MREKLVAFNTVKGKRLIKNLVAILMGNVFTSVSSLPETASLTIY